MPRQTTGREQGAGAKTGGHVGAPGARKSGAVKASRSHNDAQSGSQGGTHRDTRDSSSRNSSSQSKLTSTGSPAARDAASATPDEERTRDQLYLRAAELGINGRSRMTKAELIAAIRQYGSRRP